MPIKKGLVAPQNTFIQTIIKKFDGSPDRNFVLGNAQVSELPIIYCNEGFCELTGYSRAELVQRHCSCDFLCGQGTSEAAKLEIKDALKGTEEKHIEILYYRKDGTAFLCSVLVAPVKTENGSVVMYIVNHEDVTWSPNTDEVIPKQSRCFPLTSRMNSYKVNFKRRGKDDEEEDETSRPRKLKHKKMKERPNSLPTSTATSTVQTPEFIPLMSVHPATPPECTEEEPEWDVKPASSKTKKASSMTELSSSTGVLNRPTFFNENTKLPTHSLMSALRPDMDNLFLPIKPQISTSTSDTALWKSRSHSSVDQSLDGSKVVLSPGLQAPVLQPKKTEKVAQVMSLGADVLPEYKLQALNIHPWTILHYSPFKAFWDWLILFLVIYTAIVTPYMASFILTRDERRDELNRDPETRKDYGPREVYSDPIVILDYIVDVMFIIDIFINFRTTFVDDNDEVVSQPCRVAVHYLKTWFLIDLVAAIPFELLIMIGNTDQTTTLIGLLKTARLLRLVRVARKLDHYSEYGMAVLCLLMCSFALLAHWLACVWYAIGNLERTKKNSTIGWLDNLADQLKTPYHDGSPESGPDLESKYITALYFTLSSLTSVGFGNVSPNTNAEKVFSICVMLIGSLFYAAIFGNVAAIIARLYSNTARYHAQMQRVREFIRFHQIPSPLRQRVEDYSHHIWSYTNGIDMDQVLYGFPECLQADICLHLNTGLLRTHQVFASAGEGCLRALALRIRTIHLPPGDYILYQGDEVSHLYFIMRGTVEILRNDVIMAILGKGDSFGENFAVSPDITCGNSRASVRALTYCDLRTLARDDLVHINKLYPEFRSQFERDLNLTFSLREEGNISGSVGTSDRDSTQSLYSVHSQPAETSNHIRDQNHLTLPLVQKEQRDNPLNPHVIIENSTSKERKGKTISEQKKKCHDSGLPNYEDVAVNLPQSSAAANQKDCKKCSCDFKSLESKLDVMGSRLTTLEYKLSTDVEAMSKLLKSFEQLLKQRNRSDTEV